MAKTFNTTGVCIPELHYMADVHEKLDKIEDMISKGQYFVMNRPRQYGKTTTIYLLEQRLKEDYLIISCSFEGLGNNFFSDEKYFSNRILEVLADSLEFNNKEEAKIIRDLNTNLNDLMDVSKAMTQFIRTFNRRVVLFIDEVDKSSNNQLFINFLGLLRSKFLLAKQKKDLAFHSVILAGVHDIKNLKLKIRDGEEIKLNSPWNIAVNFDVDMSFSRVEIETMIKEYANLNKLEMSSKEIAEKLYYYTSGYPFLVSRLCQILDENICTPKGHWTEKDIDKSLKFILKENNTLFDDLKKNLENNKELNKFIFNIVFNNSEKVFNIDNSIIEQGALYGILKDDNGLVKVSNRVYEQRIYNYFASKLDNNLEKMSKYNFKENFVKENNSLDIKRVLLKFQQFMKEQYSSIDSSFIEREGRLLFLAFIKPIINGVGFDFKEVQISEEKRLDVVINYNNYKYIIELKIWNGAKYHEKGILQLHDYLENQGLDEGYLVIFNFNKNKEYIHEQIKAKHKDIFTVFV